MNQVEFELAYSYRRTCYLVGIFGHPFCSLVVCFIFGKKAYGGNCSNDVYTI